MQEKIEKFQPKPGDLFLVKMRNMKDRERLMRLVPMLDSLARKYPDCFFMLEDEQFGLSLVTDKELERMGLQRIPRGEIDG